MHGGMDQNGVGIRLHQASDGRLATMRRSVIDNPKHPIGGPVRLLCHHLSHQSAKRFKARAGLAAPHDVPAPDRPRRPEMAGRRLVTQGTAVVTEGTRH